jgi:hypothetical protein
MIGRGSDTMSGPLLLIRLRVAVLFAEGRGSSLQSERNIDLVWRIPDDIFTMDLFGPFAPIH